MCSPHITFDWLFRLSFIDWLTGRCVMILRTNFCFCVTLSTFVLYTHTVPSVGSVSLCPLLPSTVCPLSVNTSHWTVCWFCVTMSTTAFYSLSTVCQYFTMYSLLVLCHYVHCCLLQSVHCRSILHNVQSVGSVSLCPLLPSTVCRTSVNTSHCTVCWFSVTMSIAAFYSLTTVGQYFTMYSLLVLCHYVHCCLLKSVHCLPIPHNVQSVGSVSLCPLLPSTVCPLSVSTSHCTFYWFCVTMSTTAFYSLSTVCQYVTLHSLLVLCHYVHYCLLQSVHCLSIPHNVQSVGSMSLCPLLPSTVCPLSANTSHCTFFWFCVTRSTTAFHSLSTVCQYLTMYSLLVLCHYVHCCLLQSVSNSHCTVHWFCVNMSNVALNSLSNVDKYFALYQFFGSMSLCPLLSSTVGPLSVSTSHCTVCWYCVTVSTADL